MALIYIVEQGAVVRKTSRRIIAEKNKKVLLDMPIFKIDGMFVFGNIQITTQALGLLLENGVDVSFFSSYGKMRGKLVSSMSKNIFLRLAQYERWRDEQFKVSFCRSIINAKLNNMKTLIQRYHANHPEEDFKKHLDTINLGLIKLIEKKDIPGMLGIEGSSSGAYFAAFGKMFRKNLQFKKRVRHPSPDPVNALLSLGYVMVTNEIASCLEAMAFDPFLGFLHGIKYGRKSLSLDIVEEFRQPLIDSFTLKLANLTMFAETDFVKVSDGGVRLKDDKFKEYLKLYEERMNEHIIKKQKNNISWRELIKLQCRQLEKAILEGIDYKPYSSVDEKESCNNVTTGD